MNGIEVYTRGMLIFKITIVAFICIFKKLSLDSWIPSVVQCTLYHYVHVHVYVISEPKQRRLLLPTTSSLTVTQCIH